MRAYLFILLLGAVLVVACACASQPAAAPKAADEYRPTATIKDIMDAMVDPGADALWDSVAVTVSAKGTEEKAPHTDEEWKDVRNSAIRLVEGTNLPAFQLPPPPLASFKVSPSSSTNNPT